MPQLSEPLLQIQDLSKVFHIRQGFSSQEFHAVDSASIVIDSDKPEIFAIVGESGSGKTTLAKMVLGMESPSHGILRYKDRVINDISRRELRTWFYREVQPVFQDPFAAFSPLKKIDSYLFETAANYKMADKKEAPRYINEVLSEVGLTLAEIAGRYPNELSGGASPARRHRPRLDHQALAHRRRRARFHAGCLAAHVPSSTCSAI